MKRRNKMIALICACILGILSISGCGDTFDASAYIKALLDNSYKNDSSGIVELGIGTKEEAQELYDQALDQEITLLVEEATSMSTELQQEYRDVFATMFKKANYTVGKAKKVEKGSYEVTVTYSQMEIFGPALDSYQEKVNVLSESWLNMDEEEAPDEDQMYEQIFTVLKDCLKEALDDPSYGEDATTTISVAQDIDGNYKPDENELYNLERLLFDIDAVQETE